MLERILLPLDGSPTAEAILTQVRRLLKRHDSEVILVRVVEPGESLAGAPEQASRYLSDIKGRLADEGVRIRATLVRQGPPAEALLDIAAQEGASLLTMATHGRTGLSRWILGSVAEKVLRASEIPVLVMRSFQQAGAPSPREERAFAKILMPVDGSEASLAIVPHVTELAKVFGSTVLVACVTDGATSEQGLRAATDRIAAAGVRAVPLKTGGDPASLILDFSRRHMADLIAMTTHGRSGLSRWVFGSVTEKVLRASEVPMLVVRSRPPAV